MEEIAGIDDVIELRSAGASAVLIGSALHDATIGPENWPASLESSIRFAVFLTLLAEADSVLLFHNCS